ncbi:MAG: FHA domain-containing protein [Anaerolineales bacterium]|nr:MAG: FHA domain-containing protein [Anaerolineales bacterium]
MIKCPFCQTTHVPNTLFCSECGTYLLEDDRRGTDPLGTEEIRWVGPDDEGGEHLTKQGSGPLSVRLHIGEGGREVEASLTKAIHLGRLDPASDVFPEVDLSEDSGLERGVSRRHARILKREGTVVVEDLGSINGTFINGKRLAPYLPEALHDGDQLQLGKLLIEIELS